MVCRCLERQGSLTGVDQSSRLSSVPRVRDLGGVRSTPNTLERRPQADNESPSKHGVPARGEGLHETTGDDEQGTDTDRHATAEPVGHERGGEQTGDTAEGVGGGDDAELVGVRIVDGGDEDRVGQETVHQGAIVTWTMD